MDISKLVKIKAAAELLGVGDGAVRRYIREGLIGYYRHPVSGRYFLDPEEIKKLVENMRIDAKK